MPKGLTGNLDYLLELLGSSPAGLITDVDGTISPIAPTPEEAHLLPEARSALARLVPHLRLVAAVSGRQASQVEEMVGVPGMAYVGNHGLDWLENGQPLVAPEAQPYLPALSSCLSRLRDALADDGCLRVEDKGVTASLHYRACPDPANARRRLLEAVRGCPECACLQVTEGRMVVNLRPPVAADKGTAVERLIGRSGLSAVVYLGDDVTDLDAFRMLASLRASGTFRAATVAVASKEAPGELLREADYLAEGVVEVAAFLQLAASYLEARFPSRAPKSPDRGIRLP